MALQQLDANSWTPNTMANQRDSISSDTTYPHKRDENSAVSKQHGSKTPPSERLLAPTQSSAAKATSPTIRPGKPLPRSPAFISVASQAPRQVSAPIMTPVIVPRWSDRVVRRMISREKVAKDTGSSPVSIVSAETSTPPALPPTDKPLPSRPIASLTSNLSPSKDSRTLIDAIEKPLNISQEGLHKEWPALTPRSVSAPERKSRSFSREMNSAIPRKISSSANMARTSADVTKMLDRRNPRSSNASALTQHSSDPSFVSAEEPMSGEQAVERGSTSLPSLVANAQEETRAPIYPITQPARPFPARMQSLGNTLGNGTPKMSSGVGIVAHPSTPLVQSRGHSPSPASFSRPRPGSGMQTSRLPSLSKDTPSTTEKVFHQRTASRIPIPDSKKATLVDIRTLQQCTNSEVSPSFGARRLISPTALAILDQGTKRRLQRANTNGSTASTTSSSTRILNIDLAHEEQQNNRSKNSSPGDTFGPSSSDEEEITTPVVQPYRLRPGVGFKEQQQTFDAEDQLSMMPSDLNFPRLRRAPPSKSPFTGPLPTIHSQASLAVTRPEDSPTRYGAQVKPTRFPDFAQRLNEIKTAHANKLEKPDGEESVQEQDTQNALKQLLEETQRHDQLCQKDGMPGLDKETKSHLTQTLSLLEGHGGPAQEEFDHGQLEQIFGQLIPGINRTSNTKSLLNDATAAARFVEGDARNSDTNDGTPEKADSNIREGPTGLNDTLAELPANETCQTPAVSKWSDSTPSAQGNSTEIPRKEPQRSIGFPSTTSRGHSIRKSTHLREGSRRESDLGSRNSSPTLGHAKPSQGSLLDQGSVKRGRLNGERAGFARMTAAATSKKIPRPAGSVVRGLRKPEDSQRGRNSLVSVSRTASVSAIVTDKPMRSRSKSRTVLDKINGFFSHKRDKKHEEPEAPPLPQLDLSKIAAPNADGTGALFPQLHRMNRTTTPPLKTLPETSSSPLAPENRSFSRTSDKSFASMLPLDGDCDGKVLTLTDKLVIKAKQERSPKRKQRLMNFATVLTDALIHVREAQISAETARQMAEQAELSYLKTQKGVEMLSRLASSLVQSTVRR